MKLSATPLSMALLLACVLLSGCWPPASGQLEEEKETHFLAGKTRISEMDYKGAINSFEKALEVNPRSGAAHFELAWLYDQKEIEPATAIYHYTHYLSLRPRAENAEMVRTRILACKQELARAVSLGPVTQSLQREFEKLSDDNKKLREDLEKWRNYALYLQTLTNRSNDAATPSGTRNGITTPTQTGGNLSPSASNVSARATDPGTASASTRTYTIKSGDTLSTIARRYGLRVEALLSANPRVDPKRLQPGQSLVVPGP